MEQLNYWQGLNRNRLSRRRFLAGTAFAGAGLLAAGVVGCGGGEEKPSGTPGAEKTPAGANEFRLGVVGPLTGVAAPYVTLMPNTARMAVDEINEAGGILGLPVRMILQDDLSEPEKGLEVHRRLIKQDHIHAVVVAGPSNIRAVVVPEYEAATLPYQYCAYYEGQYCNPVFHCNGETTGMFARGLLSYAQEQFGGGSIYHIGNDYVWSQISDEILKKIAPEFGSEVAATELFPLGLGGVDLAGAISRVRDKKPDFIFDSAIGTDTVPILRQMEAFGVRQQIKGYFHLSLAENELPAIGTAVDGVMACFSYFQSIDSPANKEFLAKYTAKFGEPKTRMGNIEENYYNAVYFIKLAAEQAGSIDGPAIINAFAAGGLSFDAPRGKETFDGQTNYAIQPMYLAVARAGKFEVLERLADVNPKDAGECKATL
jgi:urea transport system substrate-binding protein